MVFNSLDFLVFLSAVVCLYAVTPRNWRWLLMLVASYFFYGYWKVEYLWLIALSTLVDYTAANCIARSDKPWLRKGALGASIFTNLALLGWFKYAGWLATDVLAPVGVINETQLGWFQQFYQVVLPVGISFYTFQSMSYTIDVYTGKATPERNPLRFALFVSFFPQLVAGPIERYRRLMPQLYDFANLKRSNLRSGLRLILFGLFIKMCVADNLAPIADQVFGGYNQASTLQLLAGMLSFSLQIYADFHGYSTIAIGTALLFGVRLMDNFNAPYLAVGIRDFWKRWHISLTSWFKDYLYLPLGGNRVNRLRWGLNVLVVFVLSGIWHGANFTFLIWGAIHGVAYLVEQIIPLRWKQFTFLNRIVTILVVTTAWIPFRSETISSASAYVLGLFEWDNKGLHLDWDPVVLSFAGLFLVSDVVFDGKTFDKWIDQRSGFIRWLIYALLLYSIAGFSGTINHPFIYFQF